ncbi:MAG TPA: FHA domain-containing protein, partial [Pyrinomonadaceae bacterium]|nr:FHA domain-containing protein [Pyrinomonadaceae bacterium]
MRIAHIYRGFERTFESEAASIVIGRMEAGVALDLDLAPDLAVSRLHARLSMEDGQYWIEDLDSKRGTRINDEEIRGKGKRQLQIDTVIKIGETELRILMPGKKPSPSVPGLDAEPPPGLQGITPVLDASNPALDASAVAN